MPYHSSVCIAQGLASDRDLVIRSEKIKEPEVNLEEFLEFILIRFLLPQSCLNLWQKSFFLKRLSIWFQFYERKRRKYQNVNKVVMSKAWTWCNFYFINFSVCSPFSTITISREKWFYRKDRPEIASYKSQGMNLCVWNCRRCSKLGGGVQLASLRAHHPDQCQARPCSSKHHWPWYSHFRSEKQPLPPVGWRPTYVREAGLCFTSFMLERRDNIVSSGRCKERVQCGVRSVVTNSK